MEPNVPMISLVKPYMLDSIWGELAPMLKRNVEGSTGELSLEHIKKSVEDETCLLLIITDDEMLKATVTVERVDYPSGKSVLGITSCAGDDMETWVDDLDDTLQMIARDQDCSEVRIVGRPGWARILKSRNWNPVHTILSKQVGD